MYKYHINQYLVESDWPIPNIEVTKMALCAPTPQLVQLARPSFSLSSLPRKRLIGQGPNGYLKSYRAGDGILLCSGASTKIFINNCGDRVELDFNESDSAERALAFQYFTGLVLSICTLLQGRVPLHGACVSHSGRVSGILARSGSGKSTLLWSLLKEGWMFGSDDVIATNTVYGRTLVTPSISLHSKLHKESLNYFKIDEGTCREIIPEYQKFWVPVDVERRFTDERVLNKVVVLHPSANPEAEILTSRVIGGSALAILLEHVHGLWAVYSELPKDFVFSCLLTILKTVEIYTIEYYKSFANQSLLIAQIQDVLCQSQSKE